MGYLIAQKFYFRTFYPTFYSRKVWMFFLFFVFKQSVTLHNLQNVAHKFSGKMYSLRLAGTFQFIYKYQLTEMFLFIVIVKAWRAWTPPMCSDNLILSSSWNRWTETNRRWNVAESQTGPSALNDDLIRLEFCNTSSTELPGLTF